MMPQTRLSVYPTESLTGQRKKKEAPKPYKAVVGECEGAQFIIYHYSIKGQHARIQRGRKLDIQGKSQHSMLSYKCPIPLLKYVPYIPLPPLSNLLLLCLNPTPSPPWWIEANDCENWRHRPPPPCALNEEGSDALNGREQIFVIRNSWESCVGYGIDSVGLIKYIYWNRGWGWGDKRRHK